MPASNHIKNVAIVGAGGNSGRPITDELLGSGKFRVTAITRINSTSKLPQGVTAVEVDYDNHASLVHALQSQDALVITLSGYALDQQSKLIRAAAEAGVAWVLPNGWGPDIADESLVKDVFPFQKIANGIQGCKAEFAKHGDKSAFISVCTGRWYEYSLTTSMAFGIDLKEKKANFYDDGETKISVSTFAQVGRGVAALLSLPIKPEGGDTERCLEKFRNGMVYINSFTVSQRDIFESILRVTGDEESHWTTESDSSKEIYRNGMEGMKNGNMKAVMRGFSARVFYLDGSGNFESRRGTLNATLNLPKEDLDQATHAALKAVGQESK
ncbi:hypothetical protein LTR37_000048 [Vermiconidia calcicola]|uniref:Uncharacterized protein n=1 Tax=Vermiconidia calcicola TaxID=1690605 RepID=A0ACC3P0N8_9PEZI|nr:hypothetical protein LTR37_000048 [Vermiconidia calcicola]